MGQHSPQTTQGILGEKNVLNVMRQSYRGYRATELQKTLAIKETITSKPQTLDEVLAIANLEEEHSADICLFKFARGIRTLELGHSEPFSIDELRPMFARWYEQNESALTGEVGIDDVFCDFMDKFSRVKAPLGTDVVKTAWQNALANPYPKEAQKFRQEERKQLTAFCLQLQITAGDNAFFLSCRTVQRLLGLRSHHKAARWLRGLVRVGVLKEIEKGGPGTKKASRYRFTT